MRLEGKTIIVTGASSGIGAAAALLFAVEGANLILGGRSAERLQKVQGLIHHEGCSAAICAGDVQSEAYASELVACAEA